MTIGSLLVVDVIEIILPIVVVINQVVIIVLILFVVVETVLILIVAPLRVPDPFPFFVVDQIFIDFYEIILLLLPLDNDYFSRGLDNLSSLIILRDLSLPNQLSSLVQIGDNQAESAIFVQSWGAYESKSLSKLVMMNG